MQGPSAICPIQVWLYVRLIGCWSQAGEWHFLYGTFPKRLWAVYAAIRAHGSMDVGLPAGPNFFLFSDPLQSIKALQGAGFDSPNVRQVSQVWRLDDPDGIFDRLAGSSVRAGKTLRSQSPGATAAIRAALRDIASEYKRGEHFEVPMPAIIASAIKPQR